MDAGEQAGIYAGEGGFDIEVGENTNLIGAVIGSEATPDKNELSTGTLTYEDIENKARYEANSTGITISSLPSKDGGIVKGITPNMGATINGKAETVTKSAVSDGLIEVRNNSESTLQELNRNTIDTLNKLGKIFDRETVDERQELATLFGEQAFKAVGDFAEKQWVNSQTPEEKAKWAEGGEYKVLLHSLVGMIMSELTGNKAMAGASAATIDQIIQKGISSEINQQDRLLISAIVGASIAKVLKDDAIMGAEITTSGVKNNSYGHMPTYNGAVLCINNIYYKIVDGEPVQMDNPPPAGIVFWKEDINNPGEGWDYIKGDEKDISDTYLEDRVLYQKYIEIFGKAYGLKITDLTEDQKQEVLFAATKKWFEAQLTGMKKSKALTKFLEDGTIPPFLELPYEFWEKFKSNQSE